MLNKKIILCGFMASGKTTVGRALAKEINTHYIDTDELLEVTPENLRIRKKILDPTLRKRSMIKSKQ